MMAALRTSMALILAATAALPTDAASDLTSEPVTYATGISVPDDIIVQPDVTDAARDKWVRKYWTADRIAAIDHDPVARNPPPIPRDLLSQGAEYAGPTTPVTIGRLFTTVTYDNGTDLDASCTASLLESENNAILVTAAHCVTGTMGVNAGKGRGKNNFWIPGFRDGNAPFGAFTGHSFVFASDWEKGFPFSLENDKAFVVLNPNHEGQTALDILGPGHKINFGDTSLGERYTFGYPRYIGNNMKPWPQKGSPAFLGERLAYCNGTAIEWPRNISDALTGIPCLMGAGCSGGPFIEDFDVEIGLGNIVAVNSLNDEVDTHPYLWGNRVTDVVSEKLFNIAQASTPLQASQRNQV